MHRVKSWWIGSPIIEGEFVRFDVVTLFPEMFSAFFKVGVTRRAFESGQIDVRLRNPRDFAKGPYRRIDDRPFGGGPGMVMMPEPLYDCVTSALSDRPQGTPVVLFSPVGQKLDHSQVTRWAQSEGAVLICGRYEGIDQRFIDEVVTHQISLGDFVLSGGELAAMVLLDAAARLQSGVLHDEDSSVMDSFHEGLDGLLDCPHFTRPELWRERAVPEVLLSGHHERIEHWRRQQRLQQTARLRPELIASARARGLLSAEDEAFLSQL